MAKVLFAHPSLSLVKHGSSACKTSSTLSLTEPSALPSAPTTTATAATSAPSCLTPPLPPTVFLTEDSPTFCGLPQQLDDQVSALSNIAPSLQHLLASSRNPEPQPPQSPSSQPVAATLTSAMLPAANTAGSALGAPLTGESDMDCIFSWLLWEVIQQVINDALPPQDLGRLCNPDSLPVDDEHKHAVLVNGVLTKSIPSAVSTSSTRHFTKLIPDICCFAEAWTVYTCIWACTTNDPNLGTTLWAQQDQAAWNQHLSTAASFCPPPKSATPGSTNCQANTQPRLGTAQHIDGPVGPPDLSTPPLQGLAWLIGNSASTLDLGTPPLQGSAQSVIMPVGLGGTRTPPLQGLARLFNSVLAALDVSSADQCLSLFLNVWSHDPGLHPNTSFAHNAFNLASQPTRHGSMQEHAFVWSTLLSLYPDPVYRLQLLDMTEHGCLLATALPSINTGISPGFIRIQYEGLQDLLAFVSQNLGCLLWKGDLEDAFQHVVTAKCDVHLLSFSYDGIHYHENTLTFGGSSSPWLFNLVAEFLHWLVAACLPTDWSINHYLDDTFGAIPVSHTVHALLPIYTLGLAANALGLWLSPKKTFGTSTKLKVLGIKIDTVTQTIRITDNQCHHILAQCHSLIQHRSMDLLNMQRISSLLQFMSQVFLCRKAFLRHLYNATCHALPGKCCLTWMARLELIWWCDILERWSGTSVLSPLPLTAAHIWTNACPKGYGGYLGLDTSPTAVFAKTIPRRHHKKNIHFLEALTVLEALQHFLPHWSGPTLVVVHVDNENVKHGLCLGCSCNLLTQHLLQEIFGLCLKHDLTIQPHSPAGPPPGITTSLGISAHAANLLWHSLAASTHHHASLGRPFHLAKHGLSALRSHHVDLGLDTSGFSCGCLECALRGYKRLHGIGHSGAKLPITLLLLAMGKMANLFPRDRLVLQAAFALAFACFLCSGKLVWDRSTDCTTILTVSSVGWASDHVVLTLPASKTDPFWQGVHVVTPEVGGVKCPVTCLWHLSHSHPPLALLFGLGPSGLDPLPQSTFITILHCAIQACSLLASWYTGHSFRHGMATWVSQHSASTTDIQSLGRWSSDCYHHYINRSAQECHALVASALFSVRDGPLVPSSPTWRDPGLA
ncbi:uncharacterized protein UBRO2_02720 [Ustilago bromivora]|uniref:Reverse transcriptase domain-containing protein n=1 Tax=Ustilago bromivora TaxID=307758 RepID=A0A8H8QLQ0_9BASI|nr:uncharacterized protein UBRO2_02720 [Ustilago bromivora]